MTTIYVIQTGRTTWQDQSRIDSIAGAPLTSDGINDVKAAADQLAQCRINAIYSAKGESDRQTAKLLSGILKVKIHPQGDLRELDYGLWQGLTVKEIKRRQPKVYRQWIEAPLSVCPPGGEPLNGAVERLEQTILGIAKRHKSKNGSPLVVLRPAAFTLLKCVLSKEQISELWKKVGPSLTWYGYMLDNDQADLTDGSFVDG